jgi:hypothetical protein
MSVVTNPLTNVKKKVDRELIHNPAFSQDTVAEKFKITQSKVHNPFDTPEKIKKFLKNVNHVPSLLSLKNKTGNSSHSVLVIPRNADKKVGSYDFWIKWGDGRRIWYENNITGETSWVAPKGKIFEKVGNKWVSQTGEQKDYITSIEIFEPNGMSFDRIDKIYGTSFQQIEEEFKWQGIEVIRNTKTIQGSSVPRSGNIDAERLILTAPICFKHTIVRWLKQNQSLDDYYKFVESGEYFSADDKVADIYSSIETYSKYSEPIWTGKEGNLQNVGVSVIRENMVLFSSIDRKLKELEAEGKAKVPFEIEIRNTLDDYSKRKEYSESKLKVLEERFKALLERRDELKGENFFELVDRYKKVLPADKVERITDLVTKPYNPTWFVKDEGLTSKIKNTLAQEVAKEEGTIIHNDPIAQIKPFGIATAKKTLKKGGMIHGTKDQAVPIIAHEGELIVPKKVVPAVLHSSAWKNHIEQIARSKNITFAEAKQYALGNRTIVKKVKPKKKSYWSDTSDSDW